MNIIFLGRLYHVVSKTHAKTGVPVQYPKTLDVSQRFQLQLPWFVHGFEVALNSSARELRDPNEKTKTPYQMGTAKCDISYH